MYKQDFLKLITNSENSLPIEFCIELMERYDLKTEIFTFLFHKQKPDELFTRIKNEHEKTNAEVWISVYEKYIKKFRK